MKNNRIKLDELFFSKTWDYLNEYMPKRLSRSPDTIESYTDSLTIFRHFITDKYGRSLKSFKFSECTRDCIFEFRDYLKEKGLGTVIWSDMLQPVTNYQTPNAINLLPRDILCLDFIWPKGFRMKDGYYEDICPYYRAL